MASPEMGDGIETWEQRDDGVGGGQLMFQGYEKGLSVLCELRVNLVCASWKAICSVNSWLSPLFTVKPGLWGENHKTNLSQRPQRRPPKKPKVSWTELSREA